MLIQYIVEIFFVYIALPNTDDCITAFGQIFILIFVAFTLSLLSFSQWIAAWVSMPIFTIYLQHQMSDKEIYNEFWFYDGERLKFNTKFFENMLSLYFQFIGFVTLKLLFSCNKIRGALCFLIRVSFPPFMYLLLSIIAKHWIIFPHAFSMYFGRNTLTSYRRKFDFAFVSLLNDTIMRYPNSLGYGCCTFGRIMIPKVIHLFSCPCPSFEANWRFRGLCFTTRKECIATSNRTKLFGTRLEFLPAKLTYFLGARPPTFQADEFGATTNRTSTLYWTDGNIEHSTPFTFLLRLCSSHLSSIPRTNIIRGFQAVGGQSGEVIA